MFRKIALAAAAVAALGTASLTTSAPAAAKGFGGMHFHGGHFHSGFRVYSGLGLYDGCYRNVWVTKRNGDVVLRTVNVCL
jgi:hypothetical protein